jgi:hypothetical protein
MELFGETRHKIANLILSKKTERIRRRVHYTNMKNIRKIGIVWDASKSEDFVSLSKFQQRMQERNIDVKIIGYYAGDELPDRLTAIRFLSCIKKKELSFFYKPVSEESEAFINTNFDVLIDVNFDKKFPLYYISSLSTASFKVGLFDSENSTSIFDLMMELKKPVHVENYLDQVVHYLEMINSGTTKKGDKS